jgi:hypothetical protein
MTLKQHGQLFEDVLSVDLVDLSSLRKKSEPIALRA